MIDPSRCLVFKIPTDRARTDERFRLLVAEERERDPINAASEYDVIPRPSVSNLFDEAVLDTCTRRSPRELPYVAMHSGGGAMFYCAAVDVSGGASDATTACVCLRRADRPGVVIVAAVRRWPSPHDPAAVARDVAAFLASYKLSSATADQYGAQVTRSLYTAAGLALADSPLDRSRLYLNLVPLLMTGRIELPDDPVLRRELLQLERRPGRNVDIVDHPRGQHDDVANAVALAAYVASTRGAVAPEDYAKAVHITPLTVLDGLTDIGNGPYLDL